MKAAIQLTRTDLEHLSIAMIDAVRTTIKIPDLPGEYQMCYKSAYINGVIDFTKVLCEVLSEEEKDETKIL